MQVLSSDSTSGSTYHNHLTELKFSALPLEPRLHQGISDAGFTHCTPIQASTLPLTLAQKDVAGQAQTGTGKTAAYLITLFQRLLSSLPPEDRRPGPRALVLAPTRELAIQIHEDATALNKYLSYKLGLVFGGKDYEKQRQHIASGVDVLIGTPGRFIDYYKQNIFGLKNIQVMVLDEADRMFDLGFIRDIRYVLRRLPAPRERLNMLFSATLSHRVLELAYEHMNEPEFIQIDPDKVTVDSVRQSIYFPSNDEKIPLLISLLKKIGSQRTMVFVNTRREADRLQDYLNHNGIYAKAISGDVPQSKRMRMLKKFQSGELPVLVGTDVASRGLHIPDVSHVFNYDLPQDSEDYVHRIGRTARAGASGHAVSFGCEEYVTSLPEIEEFIGKPIPVIGIEMGMLIDVQHPPVKKRKPKERTKTQTGSKFSRKKS